MAAKKKHPKKPNSSRPAPVQVGDLVEIVCGNQIRKGTVIEDRGGIGFRGRNLYRIEMPTLYAPPSYIVLPAEDFRVIQRADGGQVGDLTQAEE